SFHGGLVFRTFVFKASCPNARSINRHISLQDHFQSRSGPHLHFIAVAAKAAIAVPIAPPTPAPIRPPSKPRLSPPTTAPVAAGLPIVAAVWPALLSPLIVPSLSLTWALSTPGALSIEPGSSTV